MNKFPEELRYADGRKRNIDNTRLLLTLKRSYSLEEVTALLQETGFVLEEAVDEKKNKVTEVAMEHIAYTDKNFWIRLSNNESINSENINTLKEKFRGIGLDRSCLSITR